jgi:hypothetical protein
MDRVTVIGKRFFRFGEEWRRNEKRLNCHLLKECLAEARSALSVMLRRCTGEFKTTMNTTSTFSCMQTGNIRHGVFTRKSCGEALTGGRIFQRSFFFAIFKFIYKSSPLSCLRPRPSRELSPKIQRLQIPSFVTVQVSD